MAEMGNVILDSRFPLDINFSTATINDLLVVLEMVGLVEDTSN